MRSQKIRSFSDLNVVAHQCRQVLTLFSGWLDSSYVLKALADRGCRVTALAVDVGEGAAVKDLQEITRRFGATRRVVDKFLTALADPVELLVANDRRTQPAMTPIVAVDRSQLACRDMLVMAFTNPPALEEMPCAQAV